MRLWAADLDGDGKDELILIQGYQTNGSPPRRYRDTLPSDLFAAIRVFSDGGKRLLWEWPFPFGYGEIVDILPAKGKEDATLVVRSGNRVYGLGGATGAPRWRCEGTTWWMTDAQGRPAPQTYHFAGPVLLGDNRPGLPRFLFSGNECRLALPTDADGQYLWPVAPLKSGRGDGKTALPRDPEAAIYERLGRDFPNVLEYQRQLALLLTERCFQHAHGNQAPQAVAEFNKAREAWSRLAVEFREQEQRYRAWLKKHPKDPNALDNLAWFLVTCPDPQLHKPAEAVELAKAALDINPREGNYWNTLGAAHYRAGDWKAAIAALNKSIEVKGGTAHDHFFLAMAYWKNGDHGEARKWYAQGLAWMEKHDPVNEELRRFRAEAGLLLGG
jgi:tetratricopeptide (TPR) repeat protein